MDRHVQNALAVATHLENHPLVKWVNYPGLPSSPYHDLAVKYMPKGPGGAIFCFGVEGGRAAGKAFIESLEMISHLANVGDAKSLVIHPASTTHQQMSDEEQIAAGLSPDLIRISIGLEDVSDIIWDLDQALAKAANAVNVHAEA
jgi:O-acetylhomoserine (thiol)-lyase